MERADRREHSNLRSTTEAPTVKGLYRTLAGRLQFLPPYFHHAWQLKHTSTPGHDSALTAMMIDVRSIAAVTQVMVSLREHHPSRGWPFCTCSEQGRRKLMGHRWDLGMTRHVMMAEGLMVDGPGIGHSCWPSPRGLSGGACSGGFPSDDAHVMKVEGDPWAKIELVKPEAR